MFPSMFHNGRSFCLGDLSYISHISTFHGFCFHVWWDHHGFPLTVSGEHRPGGWGGGSDHRLPLRPDQRRCGECARDLGPGNSWGICWGQILGKSGGDGDFHMISPMKNGGKILMLGSSKKDGWIMLESWSVQLHCIWRTWLGGFGWTCWEIFHHEDP